MEKKLFKRPSSVPHRVWGKHGTIRIEDMPQSRREEVLTFMINYHLKEEPLSTIVTKTAPYAEEELRIYLNKGIDDDITLIAVDEDDNDKLVGATIARVSSRYNPNSPHDVKLYPSVAETFQVLGDCMKGIDTFTYEADGKKVVVDFVMYQMGLCTLPEYRGRGIARALINARHKLAYAAGIGASIGNYTSIFSQRAILYFPNMKTLKEIKYSDYLVDGKPKFACLNPPHPSAKVIGGLITKEIANM